MAAEMTDEEFISKLSSLLNDELHKIKDENRKKMATWWVERGSKKTNHYNYLNTNAWIKKLILTTITDKKERIKIGGKILSFRRKYFTQEKTILGLYNTT
tara:strand:+ start:1125 stop:1424 length:300 start_codon:yes stop_codon:yes gene_type:complete